MSTSTASPTGPAIAPGDFEFLPGATARLAWLIADARPATVPAPVLELMATCVLDWVGAATGGSSDAESSPAVRAALAAVAGTGPPVVVGDPATYPAQDAAFLNGTYAHSLELDDTYLPGRMHPGAPIIAAALAAADPQVPGRRWLAAVAAGYELSTRLSAALGPGSFRRGFHPTGVAGAFGAAAAVGNLRALDAASVRSSSVQRPSSRSTCEVPRSHRRTARANDHGTRSTAMSLLGLARDPVAARALPSSTSQSSRCSTSQLLVTREG